jgi:hypothetical protein
VVATVHVKFTKALALRSEIRPREVVQLIVKDVPADIDLVRGIKLWCAASNSSEDAQVARGNSARTRSIGLVASRPPKK